MDRSRHLAFALAFSLTISVACSGGDDPSPCQNCSVRPSYAVSGNVSYTGARTGRIFLTAFPVSCGTCAPVGTSVEAAGSYTIRGFEPGSWVLEARLDSGGQGVPNASDPVGTASITVASANVTNGNVALLDPSVTPVPVTPSDVAAFGGDGVVAILWDPPLTGGLETATSYEISWGTDTAAANGGVFTVGARGDGHFLHGGVSNGSLLYYKIRALVGTATSSWSTPVPVDVGPVAGDHTVSGTVSFSGTVPADVPLYLGVLDAAGDLRVTRIAPPLASPVAFTLTGVAPGPQTLVAIVDMDRDGVVDDGDLENTREGVPLAIAGDVSVAATLGRSGAVARTRTQHAQGSFGDAYAVDARVSSDVKRVVAVTLLSGPGMVFPMDLPADPDFGVTADLGSRAPAVNDEVRYSVSYSDGTSEVLTSRVTAVLSSFARNLALDTAAPYSPGAPLFTWDPPASPPAGGYGYALALWGGSASWWYPASDVPLPSTTLEAEYNVDGSAWPATLGAGTYFWSVTVVDANGNAAWKEATFTIP
jgi:hypothetical protein